MKDRKLYCYLFDKTKFTIEQVLDWMRDKFGERMIRLYRKGQHYATYLRDPDYYRKRGYDSFDTEEIEDGIFCITVRKFEFDCDD